MRILGIDPGTKRFGIIIWEPDIPKISHNIDEPGAALHYFRQINDRDEFFSHIAIEMVGHYGRGMPAGKDVFDTCILIGRVLEILKEFSPMLILRHEIKTHFCGSARAKDGNIRQALIDRFGSPGMKRAPGLLYGIKGDEWQALALAIYVWDQVKVGKI